MRFYEKEAGSRIYVKIELDKAKIAETRPIAKGHPVLRWNQFFRVQCAHTVRQVAFTLKEEESIGSKEIGRACVPVEEIAKGFIAERWVDIVDQNGLSLRGLPKLHVLLHFSKVEQGKLLSEEVTISPNLKAPLPYAYFNQRENCRVTLYQDSHISDNFSPKIHLASKQYDCRKRCWEDMYEAMSNAKHIIYITGWSLYTHMFIVRENGERASNETLGTLLKRKADEGVSVLILLWNFPKVLQGDTLDKKSGTRNTETYEFFRNTNVQCVLSHRRSPGSERFRTSGVETSTLFTHHQKSVVVDAGEETRGRRIVGFVGGIDLCDGRYDTQDHALFKTLATVHKDDFHQPNFIDSSIDKGGPREPWHDVHCKLEGAVAWDVLYNFEQRWKKVVGSKHLAQPNHLRRVLVHPLTPLQNGNFQDKWSVQLFRSIDSTEAYGFPERYEDAVAIGLTGKKNTIFERSIQDAYINAIRRAKNFIYIENQYFCGSSYAWKSDGVKLGKVDALHLVPREISLKISSKIEAGERFAVYVVIPMWPEGVPESETVQEMLDWQRRTMEMMYSDIQESMRKKDVKTDPREYLTFFCLGNREVKNVGELAPKEKTEADSNYRRAQQARRFMIYVHAKTIIGNVRESASSGFPHGYVAVDDEYIIVGSANLNQRSMDGARDTEMAIGAFQPHHIGKKEPPKGDVHGFRLSLWYEHLGLLEESFRNPESEKCVRLVNEIADYNWGAYSSPVFEQDLQGHLLRYPISLTNGGTLTTLNGVHCFPDTNAPILGKRIHVVPPIITATT